MTIKKCEVCSKKPHTQDELHGEGNRVHNEFVHGDKLISRCTVCGKEEVHLKKK